MVNLPGPADEAVGFAVLVGVLRSKTVVDALASYWSNIGADIADALRALGYPVFERFWGHARLNIGLQMRLFVEQILFSMGRPWSTLVSGFKPVRVSLVRVTSVKESFTKQVQDLFPNVFVEG